MAETELKTTNAAAEFGAGQVLAATKQMQAFAVEVAAMSRESIERTTEAIEQMRQAHGLSEILAIQTAYLRQSFELFSQHSRKFTELMAAIPLEMNKACTQAWSKSLASAAQTTEEAREKAADTVREIAEAARKV